jgi:transcriptional regulator with XRE-family HTH domain
MVRVYHDLTQTDAAEKLGLSKSYISGLEKGDKNVTLAVLEKYSEAFDIPMSSLMLFAERVEDGGRVDAVRAAVADKTLKMLDWVATISEFRGSRR